MQTSVTFSVCQYAIVKIHLNLPINDRYQLDFDGAIGKAFAFFTGGFHICRGRIDRTLSSNHLDVSTALKSFSENAETLVIL